MNPRSLKVLALFDSGEPLPRGHDFSTEFREEDWKVESQLVRALKSLGHEVRMLGLHEDLHKLIDEVRDFSPDAVFNLMEEFRGDSNLVPTVLGVLETLGVPYTGSGPAGLLLCKDKGLSKDLLSLKKVPTAAYQIVRRDSRELRPPEMSFPLIVKPRVEDASYGISMASVVHDADQLAERIRIVHESTKQDALVETYLPGREFYCALLGRGEMREFPLREVTFGRLSKGDGAPVASFKVKWDKQYRMRHQVRYRHVKNISPDLLERVHDVSRRACRALRVDGYARVDLRLSEAGEPLVLEVNPNPNLGRDEDFAASAARGGLNFESLVQAILNEALGRDFAAI